MATNTSKYGFKKPEENDFYSIEDQNRNWDLADGAIGQLNSDLAAQKNVFVTSSSNSAGWSAIQSYNSDGASYRLQLTEGGQVRLYKSLDNWSTYTHKVIAYASDI